MTGQERENALNRYASRSATPGEESELMNAAVENQEDFNALVQEEMLRELLDDPATRKIILKAAKPDRQWALSLSGFLASRVTWAAAGATACAFLVAGFLLQQPASRKIATSGIPQERSLANADELPLSANNELLGYAADTKLANGILRLEVSGNQIIVHSSRAAEILLVGTTAGIRARILVPGSWSPESRIGANGELHVLLPNAKGQIRFTALAFDPQFSLSRALRLGDPLPGPIGAASADGSLQ